MDSYTKYLDALRKEFRICEHSIQDSITKTKFEYEQQLQNIKSKNNSNISAQRQRLFLEKSILKDKIDSLRSSYDSDISKKRKTAGMRQSEYTTLCRKLEKSNSDLDVRQKKLDRFRMRRWKLW